MRSYRVFILRRAQKELARLPQGAYERTREAIRDLAINPRPEGCLKLTGRDGWRLRAGDYRIIYEINDPRGEVTVLGIGHRHDVYR